MLECTSASDPYATYPSLSERIGINVSAVRKLIDGMVTLHLSYTIIFFCFCCHSATSTAETLCTKGKQGWWQQGGRWQQCVCHHARIRRFLRWKTVFSTQENAVFTVVNGLGESFDVTTESFPDFGGFNISCYTNLPKPYIQGVYILFRR